MTTQVVTLFDVLLAAAPIAVVLVLMVGFNWGGAGSGALGWLTSLSIALLYFGASPSLIAYSQAKGALLTLSVLYIIWMALVLFNVVQEAGAVSVIAASIAMLTKDRIHQLLILSWVFSGFLQSISGFGVPIAVIAPLLIGLGFSPVVSVSAVAIGHSWSVTFGDIGTAFNALIAATGLSGAFLAPWTAAFLGITCFACGVGAAFSFKGVASVKRGAPAVLALGLIIAGTQYLLAINSLWNVASLGGGLAGLGASAIIGRIQNRHRKTDDLLKADKVAVDRGPDPDLRALSLAEALLPYFILIIIISGATFIPPITKILNQVIIAIQFPATQTARGWTTAGGTGPTISIFGHAGALLTYASILGYSWYKATGRYEPGAFRRILSNTSQSAVKSSLGIASMVGLATMMDQSGMIYSLAVGIGSSLKPLYPFLAPYIGLLGAFMTGSNTNSNVLFGTLQQNTAALLSLPASVILAAQTTGGSIGSMLAPAKIIIGCSTAGLSGQEGRVLRRTAGIGIIITALIGAIAWAVSR